MRVLYLSKEKEQSLRQQERDRLKDKNNTLLQLIVAEHDAALRRFVRVKIWPSREVDDLIQEVYMRLAQMDDLTARVGDRLDTVRNYLFQIAVNIMKDNYRKAVVRHEQSHVSFEVTDEAPASPSLFLGTWAYSPERLFASKKDLQRIQQALEKAKPEWQQAFLLSRMENMSYREISDTMGVSVSAVEKYIAAALVLLRKEVFGDE